jgi:hypothetical protein
MASADDYRRRAAECLAFAHQITDPDDKAMMIEIAAAWRRLADWAEAKKRERQKENGE